MEKSFVSECGYYEHSAMFRLLHLTLEPDTIIARTWPIESSWLLPGNIWKRTYGATYCAAGSRRPLFWWRSMESSAGLWMRSVTDRWRRSRSISEWRMSTKRSLSELEQALGYIDWLRDLDLQAARLGQAWKLLLCMSIAATYAPLFSNGWVR